MDDNGIDVKVVILGCTDVGKTSLTMRYCHNSFSTPTSATIGAAFLQKRLTVEGTKLNLQIWDTAGQERFRSMAPMYYRNAKAAILVFDVTQEATFIKIREWLNDLRRHVENDLILALVGNKCDAKSTIDAAKIAEFATEIGASCHSTSAKTGEGVNALFEGVASAILAKYRDQPPRESENPWTDSFGLDATSRTREKAEKKGCC